MREYPYPYPWKELPGTAEETAFLERRMEKLSVREGALLEGAAKMVSVQTAAYLINLTEQLDRFDFLPGVTDDAALGGQIALYQLRAPAQMLPFLKLGEIGGDYRLKNNGVFTECGYVEEKVPLRTIYTGENLDRMDENWSVRLKLASGSCPDGVWMKLPDYPAAEGDPGEAQVTMDALGIEVWEQAWMLEAECALPNITILWEQYDTLEHLIWDANNLGYALGEQGQGMRYFMERFLSALELEGCTRMDEALDISQNLGCYDFVPPQPLWESYGRELAVKRGIALPGGPLEPYFDFAAYAQAEIEKLCLTPCEHGYAARNGQEFLYEYSQPPQQGQGMEMKQQNLCWPLV